jgi:X-Pro dipeptidyl-peptidase
MWEALKERSSDARIFLHQGGHGGGGPPADYVNRFWAHYLYDVDNGIDKSPRAMIVPSYAQAPAGRGGRGATPPALSYDDYPVPGSARVTLYPGTGGNAIGTLAVTAPRNQGSEKITDDYRVSPDALAAAASSSNRLLYALPALRDTLHISGTTRVTIRLASSKAAANLSVYLVKLPYDSTRIGTESRVGVVTRGWADPQNYKSLKDDRDYTSMKKGEPLQPGKFYSLTFPLQADDQVILPGQQLAIMILSSDAGFTLRPAPGSTLTIDLDGSSFTLPVVGGLATLQAAIGRK